MLKSHDKRGWYGVDLDGTLAEYFGWVEPGFIGKPVPRMVARVKAWLAEGRDVRIFTARVAPLLDERHPLFEAAIVAEAAIHAWCIEHIGQALPVICTKDLAMIELWDDRCRQVELNTGRLIGAEA